MSEQSNVIHSIAGASASVVSTLILYPLQNF